MSTKNSKNLLKTICKPHVGCGCGKPELSDVYEPTPKPKKATISSGHSPCSKTCNRSTSCSSSAAERNVGSSSNEDYNCTSTTTLSFKVNDSSESETDPKISKVLSPCPKIVDSIAVVKDSNDPYQDFRHSMLQMIMEKEIYSKDDLKELLNCFLQLNSPCHHDIIVQAFTEIWNDDQKAKLCVRHDDDQGGDDQPHESTV
ncbi:Transcription repressor like [Melia azedarach]|uniref:Transcription repressor like n=1 Tax=Melia azedarach TaxID=155640 RepID=A0ACC1YNF7_MELAZ|nr:Transcription repressor like [Melia azedarach]